MNRARAQARTEWLHGHIAEATRLASLLAADPVRAPEIAEDALVAALHRTGARRGHGRLADALLAQLVRRSGGTAVPVEHDPEQIQALRALPRRQRAALVLRHYAELSNERAAVFLDCSPKAVGDLVTKAVAALPPEARADVREWLDSAPSPRPAVGVARALRRARRRRAVTGIGAAAALVALAFGAAQLSPLLQPDDPESRDQLLARIRRETDQRQASLPFDPDDPGAGATRLFNVSDGVVGGTLWSVSGYRDAGDNACLQLVVGYDFGSRRCMTATTSPLHAIVETDPKHRVTFISGMVGPEIHSLQFVGPGVAFMEVPIGYEPGRRQTRGFFGIALADYLLPIELAEGGDRDTYKLLRGKLTGLDARGNAVTKVDLVLAKRR
ncbi:MAG TPA: sigma factor-like helix-turn-helix DNA-binding protein [Actinomycetota bacterium]|nr:sigma factor-like helix-turn-helix DNA-binding protein [Actinomycetota bacterium]